MCACADAVKRDGDRQKKRLNGSGNSSGDDPTAEEFAFLLTSRGFPLSELDNWNTGMLLNWIYEHDNAQKKERGEIVHDNYERYEVLKRMEPEIDAQYQRGELDEERYRSYKQSLKEADDRLRG